MFSMHTIDSLGLFEIPICQACASSSAQEMPEEEPPSLIPLEETREVQGESINDPPPEDVHGVELRDPYLNPLEEIVLDTGSIPCSIHGYDHLSRGQDFPCF